MRIFYAAEFTEIVKQQMADNLLEVKKHTVKGSFTRRDDFHLTFVFVGECESSVLTNLKKAADETVKKLNPAPIDVTIGGLGTFSRSHGDILWAGLKVQSEPCDILSEINKMLLAELREVGINLKQEHNKFVPHVTIGRRVKFDECADKNLEQIKFAPINFTIDAITIMESVFASKGIIYKPLYRAEFIKN